MAITRRRGFASAILALLLTLAFAATPAAAATGDVGYRDASFGWTAAAGSDPNLGPTASKPQSKLWFNDGTWWAVMFDAASTDFHIHKLDTATQTWSDTGILVDERKTSHADVLSDGTKLYIATAGPDSTNSSHSARFLRYTYNSTSKTYSLDSGFPVTVTTGGVEAVVLAKDTTGQFWVTFTQGSKVYVNHSDGSATTWGAPFVLPVSGVNVAADDVSSIIAFRSKVGVMWSNQTDGTMYFATHADGDADTVWGASQPAYRGTKYSDDHINLKELKADASGEVFAVLKTSRGDVSPVKSTDPQIVVLSRNANAQWGPTSVFSTVGENHTRAILQIDEQNRMLYVFASTNSGEPTSAIYYKKSSLDNISFPSGQGTPFIQLASDTNLNNATSTKQNVTNSTGLVVMASDITTGRYAHNYLKLGTTATVPVASFTATPTSGQAPLPVQFTDTSTGSPTAWAWDFGDGVTATTQNPSHTYAAAGTYTVKLTASNGAGSNSISGTGVITVSQAPTTAQITAVASSTTFSATDTTSVTLSRPSGTAAGDVLVASITADANPSVSTVPTGWKLIASPAVSGAKTFAYYHVVSSNDPTSYAWTLGTARKWGAGVTSYRGVNTTTPLDTAAVTATNSSYTATSLTVPSITTVTNGAMLIGGVGLDSTSTGLVTAPSGWTERYEAGGGQNAEQADRSQATAGSTGTAQWTLSSGRAIVGWRAALRPAS